LAALALPMALAAQQPAGPPVNPMTTAFKNSGARNARLLMQAFDSIPADKFGYKPTSAQLTFSQIAVHLEAANYGLCSAFGTAKRMMTARDSTADSVKATWPKDTLVTRLKASFAFCDAAVATVDDAKLSDQVPVGPPAAGRTSVRAQLVLTYVTDLVDHYSQMANYMRLNGWLPPSALPRPGRGGQ
jgi:uncharacterized damage-inducible protein DinB